MDEKDMRNVLDGRWRLEYGWNAREYQPCLKIAPSMVTPKIDILHFIMSPIKRVVVVSCSSKMIEEYIHGIKWIRYFLNFVSFTYNMCLDKKTSRRKLYLILIIQILYFNPFKCIGSKLKWLCSCQCMHRWGRCINKSTIIMYELNSCRRLTCIESLSQDSYMVQQNFKF
jgi:hypothetical protein